MNLLYYRRLRLRSQNPDGVDFVAQDWDQLVILDACRYDKFAEICNLPGELDSTTSLASSSDEFVRTNFLNKELYDTVIFTANSWYQKFDLKIHRLIDYHDDYPNTYLTPDRFTKFVKQYLDEFDDKRLVIHYMTPHSPYLGRIGRRYLDRETVQSARDIRYIIEQSQYEATVDHLKRAYMENIEIVLEQVSELFNVLSGKTILTADHGEMLGERHFPFSMRDYQHHHGIYRDELTTVPWLTYTNGDRKQVVAEEPVTDMIEDVDSQIVDDRLRNLGYVVADREGFTGAESADYNDTPVD